MIVLDSDVLIDVLRKTPSAVAFLHAADATGEELATTCVNVAEVLRGANASTANLATATAILAGLTQVPFGPRAAQRFGRIMHALDKAGKPMPVVDGMVAAVTLEAGARLATRNAKHYKAVPRLETVKP